MKTPTQQLYDEIRGEIPQQTDPWETRTLSYRRGEKPFRTRGTKPKIKKREVK